MTLMALLACNGTTISDPPSESPPEAENRFWAPDYDPDEVLPATFAADLSGEASAVQFWQDKGEGLAQFAISSGAIEYDEGTVQLIELYQDSCPDDIGACDETDSAILGVGPTALIADFSAVRDQGARGTCVAFAITAAVEILVARQEAAADLSEQYTYLLGKTVEQEVDPETWSRGGLYPDVVVEGLAEEGLPLAREADWPYNTADRDCTDYLDAHPEETCSETEAQGGGSGRDADPEALASAGPLITEAHLLYGSLGRVKQALHRGYPVVLSINANSDFAAATYKSGITSWVFQQASCEGGICGHAVLAVGYADDEEIDGGGFLVIRNSWDAWWGDDGYTYATYEWVENSLYAATAIVSVQ